MSGSPTRNLAVRTMSACVFVPAVVVLVHAGGWLLLSLVLLIVGRGSWEFFHISQQKGWRPASRIGLVLALAMCGHIYLFGSAHMAAAVTVAALVAFGAALFRGTEGFTTNALLTLGGAVYVGLLGSAPLLIVRDAMPDHVHEAGNVLVLLFVCVWLTDAVAYLCGIRWGRAKLAPAISPGKTRVGCATGTLGGLVPVILHGYLPSFGPWELFGLLLVTSVGGQAGDLIESAVKRDMGVKDAPSLIPGHGGVLDRFDSYLVAFPVAYLYIRYVGIF